jgi:hypothetical protein
LWQTIRDFDPWYVDMKAKDRALEEKEKAASAVIPSGVISFHYVSQNESLLLHRLISTKCALSAGDLFRQWPSSDQDLGHYSRRIKNESEAEAVHRAICHSLKLNESC